MAAPSSVLLHRLAAEQTSEAARHLKRLKPPPTTEPALESPQTDELWCRGTVTLSSKPDHPKSPAGPPTSVGSAAPPPKSVTRDAQSEGTISDRMALGVSPPTRKKGGRSLSRGTMGPTPRSTARHSRAINVEETKMTREVAASPSARKKASAGGAPQKKRAPRSLTTAVKSNEFSVPTASGSSTATPVISTLISTCVFAVATYLTHLFLRSEQDHSSVEGLLGAFAPDSSRGLLSFSKTSPEVGHCLETPRHDTDKVENVRGLHRSLQHLPADTHESSVQNGSTVVFARRSWQKSKEAVDGQHFYFDTESSKSQWLPPVLPRAVEYPVHVTVVSSKYTAYDDGDESTNGSLVVDCAALYSPGPNGAKHHHRVVFDAVPLTELELVPGTPSTSIEKKRQQVKTASTTIELLRRSFVEYSERPFLGQETAQGNQRFTWTTYRETYDVASGIIRSLISLGIPRGSFVGLCAHNSVSHVQTLLALMLGGYVAVPLSCHLNVDHAQHIVHEAKLRAVFVSPDMHDRFWSFTQATPVGHTLHVFNCLDGSFEHLAEWIERHEDPILSQATALSVADNASTKNSSDASDLKDDEGACTTPQVFEGVVTGVFDGDVWLQLQIIGEPQPLHRSLVPSFLGKRDSKRVVWGRWQMNGSIEEVQVTWDGDSVSISNKRHSIDASSDATLGLALRIVVPRTLFDTALDSREVPGSVFLDSRKGGEIGRVKLRRRLTATIAKSDILQWRCPIGHPLSTSMTRRSSVQICDVCNQHINSDVPSHSCAERDDCPVGYDVCDQCFLSARLCPNGHAAFRYTIGQKCSTICDACDAPLCKGACALGCLTCDFDICSQCSELHPEGPPPMRDDTVANKRKGSEPVLILYTSGSTGAPKGAVVTAAAFFAEVHPFVTDLKNYDGSGVGLIDAPLSVSATPYNLCAELLNGGRVAVYQTLTRVFEIARIISPHAIGLVPQLWAVLYKQYSSELAKRMSERGQTQEISNAEVEKEVSQSLDQEFKHRLGFRARGLNCGGATPMPLVQRWLKRVFTQCCVTENYASTEAGPITTTFDGDTIDGAGRIATGITVRLVDCGEYKTTDKPYPRGEVLVKTQAGAVGYLNRPDLTAEAWDKDGFYHTGDIGEMPDSEHIKLIDRKKNIFKLLNGEWVSPENVEACYTGRCPSITQVFIHGTSRHTHVVAVVVVAAGCSVISHDHISTEILEEMKHAALEAQLRHFEIPLAIHVLVPGQSDSDEAFTVENGGLTQTCKLCRPKLRARFETILQDLFLQTAKVDAKVDEDRASGLVTLLGKVLQNGVTLTSKDEEQWAEFGWDSIRTLLSVNLIREHFHVDVSVDEMLYITGNNGGNIHDVVSLIHRAQAGQPQGHRSKEVTLQDLEAEGALPQIDLLTQAPSATPSDSTRKVYFLTGATGFLGAAILRYLAEMHVGEAWLCACLVRPAASGSAVETRHRLESSLRSRQQFANSVEVALTSGSIRVVDGTLGEPFFGLGKDEFVALGASLAGATVIHCASQVSHVANYWTLKRANVDAVTDLVNLAILTRVEKCSPSLIHYVSTVSVVDGDVLDEKFVGSPTLLARAGGYAQSKWVAEIRFREAADSKLIRLSIVRPGLLSPDTRSGSANLTDWLTRYIGGSMLIGGYRIDRTSSVDHELCHLTPVDHAAAYVCQLQQCADIETSRACQVVTYHVPVSVVMPVSQLLEQVTESASRIFDRHLRELSEEQWTIALEHLPHTNPLVPFRGMFRKGLAGVATHEHRATTSALKTYAIARPGDPSDGTRSYTSEEIDLFVAFIGNDSVVSEPAIVGRTASGSGRRE